ncbi:MAG: 2Fe-2S iron-sulfur cluster-binding protein [Burkholderiales bacterium]
MSHAFADIAFTPAVRAAQTRMGSRKNYESFDRMEDRHDTLGPMEQAFIEARDGFYQATVSETGWPYVQFRGGPAGFLKVLDGKTLGYADFRGNVQYVSVGNLHGNDRVAIILMDYAHRQRLKILGRARLVNFADDPALIAKLELPHYRARVERGVVITVEAYDWNCPQHITPRFTEAEIETRIAPLREAVSLLKTQAAATQTPAALGNGPLALRISGVRELTPRVRAYELRAANGDNLPALRAGAHIDVPVRLTSGVPSTRRYSICSDPLRRDAYEIAVLREDHGSGGSAAVHANFQVGMMLHCGIPGNDFPLHDDARPAVLIAGGIGITPIRAMARELQAQHRTFALHYAVRARREAAYLNQAPELAQALGATLHIYAADEQQRLDVAAVVANAAPDSVFYVCGPARLIDAVREAAAASGMPADRVRYERFAAAPASSPSRAINVTLQRSGKNLTVTPDQSILEAVEAAGVPVTAGCRAGNCRTCAVNVVAGAPEHRDTALSDAERSEMGLMCICVSRAQGDTLTLDL